MAAFALAPSLESRFRQWSQRKALPRGFLAALMGDSRRLFANHFFTQSDVYLHGGYYPTIFDRPAEDHPDDGDEHHNHEEPGQLHGPACEHDFLGKPRNWLDAFGRHFFPSRHTHLGEGKTTAADAREILPWIKLAAELDPQKVDTYTVGAYWLRQMGKNEEALQFLREGQRANPESSEILFDLGCCYEERRDNDAARRLWELAWRRWQAQQNGQPGPSPEERLLGAQILGRLARAEAREQQRDKAVHYLELLKLISPRPDEIQKRIEEVKAGLPFEATSKR
jgi:tetratricopeptide (TPR) repeat protein